jgi:hypothetical protein
MWNTSSQSLSIQNPTSATTSLKVSGAGEVTAEFSKTGSTGSSIFQIQSYQIALIILGVLIIAVGCVFVIRRRERRAS